MKKASYIVLIISFFLISCGRKEKDVTIATAGEQVLTGKAFRVMLPYEIGKSSGDDAFDVIESWANEELLAQAAVDLKLDKKPETEQRVSDARRMILASAFEQEYIAPRIKIDSTDLIVYYQANINEFVRTEDEVRCEHIMVSDSTIADTIARLIKSVPFEDLADEFSEDPNRGNGGDIGFLAKSQMHPLLAQAAFAMNKGDVTGPIETEFGFHFLKSIDFAPKGTLKDFSLVESEIKDILTEEKFRELYESVLDSLKKEKGLSVDSIAVGRILRANEK